MRVLAVICLLVGLAPAALGATDDPVRLLVFLARGSSAEAVPAGYRIRTSAGFVSARRTGYGWRMEPGPGLSGVTLRAHGNGWLVERDEDSAYYRTVTGGYSVEPGGYLRAHPTQVTLEETGIEALFRGRHR